MKLKSESLQFPLQFGPPGRSGVVVCFQVISLPAAPILPGRIGQRRNTRGVHRFGRHFRWQSLIARERMRSLHKTAVVVNLRKSFVLLCQIRRESRKERSQQRHVFKGRRRKNCRFNARSRHIWHKTSDLACLPRL